MLGTDRLRHTRTPPAPMPGPGPSAPTTRQPVRNKAAGLPGDLRFHRLGRAGRPGSGLGSVLRVVLPVDASGVRAIQDLRPARPREKGPGPVDKGIDAVADAA